jgi:hypothetical protein
MAKRTKATERLIKRIQANEDRGRAARVARLKTALAQSDFLDHELTALEAIAFGAFGRTKLSSR